MKRKARSSTRDRADVRRSLVVACVSAIAAAVTGCSKDEPDTLGAPITSGSGAPAAGSAGVPVQPPTGPASAGAQSGQPSGAGSTASGGSGGTPASTTDGGQPPEAGDAGPMVDCTQVEWGNRGMVDNPEVVAVADDAGMGVPFEQSAGMDEYDYVMQEFFFSGTSPAYTSRMVVHRPRDPAKFSGTVFVEWYNVSGGIDFAVLWANSREYFMREGHVFVGVSAQQVGANALKDYDPGRYGAINHPGDTSANAIFSQAGVALRAQTEALLGPCMPARAVLAVGQSQSSMRLADYVNNAHPSDRVYDGFMLHSGREPASNDPGVPTFVIFTMSEGNGSLSDGPTLVEWMVAGATHNDKRVTTRGADLGTAIGVDATMCLNPMNEFPSYRAYNAALHWLHRWVREGEKPPAGMPFQMSGSQLAQDEHDNALGGVRLPDIDVPIATYGLDNGPADPLDFIGLLACGLGGQTIAFTEAELTQLYPTHDDYVAAYTAAADEALAGGYLLQADYDEAVMQARNAAIPK